MSVRSVRSLAAALALALGASGCGVLSPRSDPSRFFLLATIPADPATPALATPPGMTFGVGPVVVAEYLDRPELVDQITPTEIRRDTYLRWAEMPDSMVSRLLLENLGLLLGPERVIPFPWYSGHEPTYQFRATIERMERRGDEAQLVAVWRIVHVATDQIVWVRYSEYKRPLASKDPNVLVQGLSDDFSDLAREMVAALKTALEKGPPAGAGK